MASFNSLPDELILKIVKMAANQSPYFGCGRKYDQDFLVDVLCKVSGQFKRVATDSSLWKGCVNIWMSNGMAWEGKDRFVVEECVNFGTRDIRIVNCGTKFSEILLSTKAVLKRRFPDLNWIDKSTTKFAVESYPRYVWFYREDEDSDDGKEA